MKTNFLSTTKTIFSSLFISVLLLSCSKNPLMACSVPYQGPSIPDPQNISVILVPTGTFIPDLNCNKIVDAEDIAAAVAAAKLAGRTNPGGNNPGGNNPNVFIPQQGIISNVMQITLGEIDNIIYLIDNNYYNFYELAYNNVQGSHCILKGIDGNLPQDCYYITASDGKTICKISRDNATVIRTALKNWKKNNQSASTSTTTPVLCYLTVRENIISVAGLTQSVAVGCLEVSGNGTPISGTLQTSFTVSSVR